MSGLREVLDQLNSRWHGRAEQIQSLIALLAPALYDKASLHVYGPAGSGKTGLLRDTLLTFDFAVAHIGSLEVDCSHSQLWAHVINSWRREVDEPEKRVQDDQEAQCAIEDLRKHTQRPLCVLVDAIDSHIDVGWVGAILEFWKRSPVPFTVIMVSLVPWLSVFGNSCPPEPRPHPIHFRKYSKEDITKILCKQRPEHVPEQLFATMVRSFVWPQYHVSVLLTDAQTLMADLIEEAMQANIPLTDTTAVMEHLQSNARKRIAQGVFFEDFPGLACDVCKIGLDDAVHNVVAAHVASNNKPSADIKNFSVGPSQKRKKDAMASDRQAMAAQKQMDSEGQIVESDHNPSVGRSSDTHSLVKDMQSVAVLNQMKQLSSTRLVNQVIANKDAIEGVSFTSNIPCELAESIAKSVHVNLQALLSFV